MRHLKCSYSPQSSVPTVQHDQVESSPLVDGAQTQEHISLEAVVSVPAGRPDSSAGADQQTTYLVVQTY